MLSSLIVIALIISSIALTVNAVGLGPFYYWLRGSSPNSKTVIATSANNEEETGKNTIGTTMWMRRCRPAWERRWSFEVSEEFEENVINIAKSDPDVQELLDEGYNITRVTPKIVFRVEADGTVVMKATSAVITLAKDRTGWASVWVDVEEEKVTRIVIVTVTVIEKS
jgi:hypothetical protein